MFRMSAAMELAGGHIGSDKLCLLIRSVSAKGIAKSEADLLKAGDDLLSVESGVAGADAGAAMMGAGAWVVAGDFTTFGSEPATETSSFLGVKAIKPLQNSFLPNCTLL